MTNTITSGAETPRLATLKVPGPRFGAELVRAFLRSVDEQFGAGARVLILDLGGVEHIDSLGVSALASVLRRAPAGSRVLLASLTPYVQTVARVTHLPELFDIYADVPAAEKSVRS